MKFVPIRKLAKCLDYPVEKVDKTIISSLKEKVTEYFKTNKTLQCNNQKLTLTDVLSLLDGLNKDEHIVFHDWIQNNKGLSHILNQPDQPVNFEFSNDQYKGHMLEKAFYSFLTPFLQPIIQEEIDQNLTENNFERLFSYFQFTQVINQDVKTALQQTVVSNLRTRFSLLSDIANKELITEDTINQVNIYSERSIVVILNLLDNQFYSLKIQYVDTLKLFINHSKIEGQIQYKLFQSLFHLKLNASHKTQLNQYIEQRKTTNKKKEKVTFFNRALLSNPLSYLLVLVILIFVFTQIDFDIIEKKENSKKKASGLDSLTLTEVKQTDSLLAYKEDSILNEGRDIATPIVMPDFILSTNTKEIKQKNVAQLYESMLKDYEIQQNRNSGSNCEPMSKSKYVDFNYVDIPTPPNNINPNHELINNSNFDCYVLYYENKTDGEAFGTLIPAGGRVQIKLPLNWNVIFYSGNEFTNFNPLLFKNNGYGNLENTKKISEIFDAHFCEMNYKNFKMLSKIYTVKKIDAKSELKEQANGVLNLISNSLDEMK
ncbi:MAG: hypothetical protein WED10_09135 [Brumimicrobium sp.]